MMKFSVRYLGRVLAALALTLTTLVACKEDEESIIPSIELHQGALYASEASTLYVVTYSTYNAVGINLGEIPAGWSVVSDFGARALYITSPAADNEEAVEAGTLIIYAYSSTGNTVNANLYVSRQMPIDLSAEQSNCYVITQADKSYSIPVTRRGEGEESLATASVKVVWQSPGSLVSNLLDSGDAVSFRIPGDEQGELIPGNALLAAYDANGTIIWTWHLWITDSMPKAVAGYMDRNLGANYARHEDSAEILNSYGTYYQWGRMTPFVGPRSYDCSAAEDAYMFQSGTSSTVRINYQPTSASIGTVAYALANPLVYLLGTEQSGYDWCFEHDNTLWGGATKSLYDPCPKGWRVAENFEGWQIADDLTTDLKCLEAQYGWNLTNGEDTLFFLGGGRRSWLQGTITNVNTNEVPKPWIGYYWTAGSESGGDSTAMYFTLDTEDATQSELHTAQSSPRANGMQVRCVKE